MTLDSLRQICRALPGATEDVKWGQDLCFCVGSKMFAAVNLEPPHQIGFKCTPETFPSLCRFTRRAHICSCAFKTKDPALIRTPSTPPIISVW